MKSMGAILAELRGQQGLSQKDLAVRLREAGIDITNQAVSKWETGATLPNAAQFLTICQVLGVTDVLQTFTGKGGLDLMQGLNRQGRNRVYEYIELLKLREEYREQPAVIHLRQLPLYHIAASAGTGQFLDSDDYETVEVGDEVPNSANFGVRLAGDSMEPLYHNGDVVWVMQDRNLHSGEIGVFLWQGDVYCKKLDTKSGRVRLQSLNPAYNPIEVDEDAEFRIFGRVVAQWNTGM